MKSILNIFLMLGLVVSVGLAQAKEDVPASIDGAVTVNAEGLIDLVDQYEDLVIIDSRKPSDREKGFIEGSVGLPDTDTTPESLAQHIASKSTSVVFYCNGVKCGRSVTATKVAIAAGYSKVYWFRTGWEEWTTKGYPVAH